MAFETNETEFHRFDNYNDLLTFTENEKDRFSILPIRNFIDNQSCFFDDKYYGTTKEYVEFNEDGFAQMCRRFQLPKAFLSNLSEDNLASKTLNNAFKSKPYIQKLNSHCFVVDTSKSPYHVVGVVSDSYVGYSNQTFIEELQNALSDLEEGYRFQEAYWNNTRLHLRTLSNKIRAGNITGSGGKGKDISEIGVEFQNSMIGDRTLSVSYFIFRLICANGLIVPTGGNEGRVFHRGKPETFADRIERNVIPVLNTLKDVAKHIDELMGIPFDPEKLVESGGAKHVYNVIGLYRSEREERDALRGMKVREFDMKIITRYPNRLGGEISKRVFSSGYRDNQSMFDFINVFTEFAKEQPPRKRLEIEEKAGKLTNWILENKKKFL